MTAPTKALTPFEASFKVEALGFTLGKADHKLSCKNHHCELTSHATPTGLARRLIGEEGRERVQLELKDDQLSWLAYENKTLNIRNQEITDQTLVRLNMETQEIENQERNLTWPYTPTTFDPLSMAYALQHRIQHNQPLDAMLLQEERRQRPLAFELRGNAALRTPFQSQLTTQHYVADSPEYMVSVWLASELNHFPVQVEIHDKKRRRSMRLSLLSRPNFDEENRP
ncbi:DUF3108 domain-containing protein [Thiomicrospira microaerophila]|uniref:DUF3108 domain-containing protein n=1 Tax=Thiomicrospira microaerophila TaxID=406020 RepID=UPI00200BBF42|nr:DUF3108 domain-containing protein [Thiomicrospira microaerophila]UQB43019.1 DUF3108 domain-containing protein [Thiomicrospira microaerophila]